MMAAVVCNDDAVGLCKEVENIQNFDIVGEITFDRFGASRGG
jgi:hypothetical protein